MKKAYLIIPIWFLLVYMLKSFHFLSDDLNTVKEYILEHKNVAFLLFIALWIVRLLFLIPGTTLIVIGGVCLGPIEGLFVSTVGQLLSGTLVYLISKHFTGNKAKNFFDNRYPMFNELLATYNYKFLALGMICPVAPTDIICFLSASAGIKYSTYILTIMIANIPLRIVYSYVGASLLGSKYGLTYVILSFVLIAAISIKIWNILKQRPGTEMQ